MGAGQHLVVQQGDWGYDSGAGGNQGGTKLKEQAGGCNCGEGFSTCASGFGAVDATSVRNIRAEHAQQLGGTLREDRGRPSRVPSAAVATRLHACISNKSPLPALGDLLRPTGMLLKPL